MPKKKTVECIVSDECDKGYCLLKELIMRSGMSDYMLMQMKCIEKFKYEESQREGKDIGWEEAVKRWTETGHAERFREFYTEEINFENLYYLILYYKG